MPKFHNRQFRCPIELRNCCKRRVFIVVSMSEPLYIHSSQNYYH